MRRPGRNAAIGTGLVVLCLGLFAAVDRDEVVFWWHGYRLTWLPDGLEPHRLNGSCDVACLEGEGDLPVLWSAASGKLTSLGRLLDAGEGASIAGINDRGHVIGTLGKKKGDPKRGFYWTEEGGMEELLGPDGKPFSPRAVNSRDQVVGCGAVGASLIRPLLWEPGSPTRDLEGPDGSIALDINDDGLVLLSTGALLLCRPGTTPVPFADPDLQGGCAVKLDARGGVLGARAMKRDSRWGSIIASRRPFLWAAEKGLVDIPMPPGFEILHPEAVGKGGAVLLRAENSADLERWWAGEKDYRAPFFLYDRGRLENLPLQPGYNDVAYYDVNEHGWLVGAAMSLEGKHVKSWRGFLARPIR